MGKKKTNCRGASGRANMSHKAKVHPESDDTELNVTDLDDIEDPTPVGRAIPLEQFVRVGSGLRHSADAAATAAIHTGSKATQAAGMAAATAAGTAGVAAANAQGLLRKQLDQAATTAFRGLNRSNASSEIATTLDTFREERHEASLADASLCLTCALPLARVASVYSATQSPQALR